MARPHALPGIPAVRVVGRQQHLAAVWDGAGQSFQKDRRAEPTGDAAQKRRTQHWVRVPVGYVLPIPGRGPHAPELFKETNMIQISKRIKQREQLALALLQQPSLEKAAAAVGISTTTAWRIGKTPEFEEQFERARRDAYDQMSFPPAIRCRQSRRHPPGRDEEPPGAACLQGAGGGYDAAPRHQGQRNGRGCTSRSVGADAGKGDPAMNFAKRIAKLEQSRAASQACGAVLAGGGTGENGSRAKLYAMFPDQGPYRRELYPRHVEFLAAGATFRERLFMAANRTGRTETGAYEMACHLTGRYPDWWQGRRFSEPINAWACGTTNGTTRDIVQDKLLGPKAHAVPG